MALSGHVNEGAIRSGDGTVGPLHEVLERELSAATVIVPLTELLCSKLRQQGIELSRRQKRLLRTRVAAADFANVKLNSWKWWQKKEVTLEITKSDLKDLDLSAQRLIERLPDLMQSLSDDLATNILRRLRTGWPHQARYQGRIGTGFRKRLAQRWSKPLNLFEMLLTIAVELGDGINTRQRTAPSDHPNKVDVLTRLHARACQIGTEVVALLRFGLADGALARWRTLHEVAVVSVFISKGDDDLAERYSLHQVVESRRAAEEYQRYCDRIGYERMEMAEVRALEDQYVRLVNKYGPEYREQYGWAAHQLGLKSPGFADIERAVEIDHLRPFYRMASHNIHANPKGVFFKLGLVGEEDILLIGPSNVGLADPGSSAANSILLATTSLIGLDTTLDVIVALKIMMILSTEVAEAFEVVQNQIESEVA